MIERKFNGNGEDTDFEIVLNPIKSNGVYSTNIQPIEQNSEEIVYDVSKDIGDEFSEVSTHNENKSSLSTKQMNNALYGSTYQSSGRSIGGDHEHSYPSTRADKQ